ncbi:MAG: hypothetical protein QE280_04250 [Caulobacter sp.]|nr:hypothetical protein [Caulobacter sp.]
MAMVTGTADADFIHRSGDGRVASAIYNEIASTTAGADDIDGGDGDDIIYGDDGDDQIIGGLGTDWLYGGEGDDSFLIRPRRDRRPCRDPGRRGGEPSIDCKSSELAGRWTSAWQ